MEQYPINDSAAVLSVHIAHQCMPAILVGDMKCSGRSRVVDADGARHRLNRDGILAFLIQLIDRDTILSAVNLDIIRMLVRCCVCICRYTHTGQKHKCCKQGATKTSKFAFRFHHFLLLHLL